jgi:hypothetical protein
MLNIYRTIEAFARIEILFLDRFLLLQNRHTVHPVHNKAKPHGVRKFISDK